MAGLAKSRTEVETTQELPASQQEDTKENNTRSTKPKKKVTFDENAKDGNEEQTTSKQQRHMDVSFAPLRESRSSLRPKSTNFDGLPMKMNVVERQPQKRPVDQYSGDGERIADSDDESDEELGNNVAKGSPSYTSDDRQSDEDDGSTSDLVLGSDDDMDVSQAQLQREAALEYFRLRESMGAELSQVLSTTTHDEDDPWNRPVRFMLNCAWLISLTVHFWCRRYHWKPPWLLADQNQVSRDLKPPEKAPIPQGRRVSRLQASLYLVVMPRKSKNRSGMANWWMESLSVVRKVRVLRRTRTGTKQRNA